MKTFRGSTSIRLCHILRKYSLCILLLSSCSHLFYQPDHYKYSEPSAGGYEYTEHFFDLDSKTRLHAWKIKSKLKETKGTVLFFHGNGQNLSAHFFLTAFLPTFGYQVFIWDYPGYGKSTSSSNQKNVFLSSLRAIDEAYLWHQKSAPKSKFIVWGQSLGGTVSLPAVARSKKKENIDLYIIESSFLSYQGIAFDKLTSHWLSFIFSPLAYFLVSDEYAADKFVKELEPKKVLIIHSKGDEIVPYRFGKEIFELYQGPKDFWTYQKEKHIQIFANKEEQKKLISYFESLKKGK